MTKNNMNQSITHKQNQKAIYNFNNVKNVNATGIFNAITDNNDKSTIIGKIFIPAVGIKLPIYLGLANNNLISGIGTMIKNQKMGKNNYALAGHHMKNDKLLFGPLMKVKINNLIYITDGTKIYQYKVKIKKIINEYQVNWVTQKPKKSVITLITCATGNPNETNRIMVRGNLEKNIQK
ncbi:class A sortase [Apilactobacillus micheneri]|nr:class A sortase [Apilactobacillus micheneri]